MKFNRSKFQCIQIGKDDYLQNNHMYLAPNETELILPSDKVQDLWVVVDCRLDFKDHVDYIYI